MLEQDHASDVLSGPADEPTLLATIRQNNLNPQSGLEIAIVDGFHPRNCDVGERTSMFVMSCDVYKVVELVVQRDPAVFAVQPHNSAIQCY